MRLSYTDTNKDGIIQPRQYFSQTCDGPFIPPFQIPNCISTSMPGEIVEVNNYYPFGLLHNYTATTQNAYQYKYNGKELQETGMYDYGARFYMPDLGRWGVVDPKAELMRRWSPYNYTFDNPIRFVDPDGRAPEWIRGTDGKKVTYKQNADGTLTWSKNASADTKKVGNALARTNEGLAKLKDAVNAKHEVSFSVDTKKTDSKRMGGTTPEYKLNEKTGEYDLTKMKIVIYEGTIKTVSKRISETKNELVWDAQALEYGKLHDKNDVSGMISATAAHEITHATDPKNIIDGRYNANNDGKKGYKERDIESVPERSEDKVLKELNK